MGMGVERVFVTFSGLDGAGKSTLIEWLERRLAARDRAVTVFHMNDHIGLYAYLRFARNRVVGAPPPPDWAAGTPASPAAAPRRPNWRERYRRVRYRILWNKALRRLVYPLDLLVFAVYRFYHEVLRRRVLIMDRYFYDTLVDVFDPRRGRWLRLLERLTPTPTLPIFLDVTPEESFRRKGEYTVEYLAHRSAAYQAVFAWVPSAVTLAHCDLPTSQAILERAVGERLEVRR